MNFIRTTLVYLLTLEARFVLYRYQPKIVVITGSVGKTSTKDAVAAALQTTFRIWKSKKSYNSDIGVPLSILNIENPWSNPFLWIAALCKGLYAMFFVTEYPEYLILEVGADKPGDIRALTPWLIPDVVVVTRIPPIPVHVAFYTSPEEVFAEETLLVHSVKQTGLIVLNNDEEPIRNLKNDTIANVSMYGTTPAADVYTKNLEYLYEKKEGKETIAGIAFFVEGNNLHMPIALHGALGVQHVYPVLAACAVGLGLGIKAEALAGAFYTYQTPPGRMRIIEGIKGSILIDDSYNASPVATEAALQVLRDVKARKKIAVLGDMRELGNYSKDEHLNIGASAAKSADILVTVGIEARLIAEGALDGGLSEKQIYQFDESREAGKFLESLLEHGTLVLIKGSQGIRMERAVQEIMLHPENHEDLLVRQEPAWQKI